MKECEDINEAGDKLKTFIFTFTILLILTGCTSQQEKTIPSQNPQSIALTNNESVYSETENDIIYTNNKLGFNIKLPKSWEDSYIIQESDDGIDVYFIGQSKTSKNESDMASEVGGLYLFSIATKNSIKDDIDSLDSIEDIGTAKGKEFVTYTGTDCSICILNDEEDSNVDNTELNLRKADWQKASKMYEDRQIVVKSFKSND
ncbi:hypothetical protein D3C78_1007550 [compost metagenome]